MDKCPKCGNKLSSIDVLCPKCGALVEVVQIKKSAGVQGASSGLGIPMQKLPHQNLIVYNDDWPTDDTEFSASQEDKPSDAAGDTASSTAPEEAGEPFKPFEAAPGLPDTGVSPADGEIGSEDDYLAMFRKMRLPELEDIGADVSQPHGFEPEGAPAAIVYADSVSADTAYADSVSADTPYADAAPAGIAYADAAPADIAPVGFSSAELAPFEAISAQHRWLELEELSGDTSARIPESVPAVSPAPAVTASDDEPHRYRYRSERRQAEPPAPKRRAGRIGLMIVVWLLVVGALFCGFFFLDQYVTERYGSYPAMIYEMSGGNVDLVPSAEPTPAEAPAP